MIIYTTAQAVKNLRVQISGRLGVIMVLLSLVILLAGCGNKSLRMSLTGDILLDRGVNEKISAKGSPYLFQKVKGELKKSGIVFSNLECPISETGLPVYKKRKKLVFNGDTSCIPSMKSAGISVVSLANNHSMDYGRKGIMETIKNLNSEGIETVGAGLNRREAHKPVFIKKSGVTVGFICYSTFPPEGRFYLEDQPDVAYSDEKKISKEISSAKTRCDILIVNFHWGREFSFRSTASQKKLAHISIDSGADMVIGQHPHVLEGIEEYKGKYIFYSLGSFVFDKQNQPGTNETVLLNVNATMKGIGQFEIIPMEIIECQPQEVNRITANAILKRLQSYSDKNVKIKVSKEKGKGYINN